MSHLAMERPASLPAFVGTADRLCGLPHNKTCEANDNLEESNDAYD